MDAETEAETFHALIDGLRSGEPRAERAFWERFGSGLHGVASGRLSPQLRQRVGPEDIVQSVCRTFLRRAKQGEFQLDDAEQLWRLLCAIALTKVREQARFHGRHRRAIGVEVHAEPESAMPLADGGPAPDEAIRLTDAFDGLLEALEPESRTMVLLKIDDRSNAEIATQLGCSERTVRRLLERVRAHLLGMLVDP